MKRLASLSKLICGSLLLTGLLVSASACTQPDQTDDYRQDTTGQAVAGADTNATALMNQNDRLVIVSCCEPDSVVPETVSVAQGARLYFSLINAESATVTLPSEVLMPQEDTTKRVMSHDGRPSVSFHIKNDVSGMYPYRIEVEGCPGAQRMMLLRPRMIVSE